MHSLNGWESASGLELITGPDLEPIELTEAKQHLRVEHDDEDTLIERYVAAARMWAEDYTRRALISQSWRQVLEDFPSGNGEIRTMKGRMISVERIQYQDSAGDTQQLHAPADSPIVTGNVQIIASNEHYGRIRPSFGLTWPSTRDEMASVQIEFTTGFGTTPEDMPPPLLQALLYRVTDFYEFRGTIDLKSNAGVMSSGTWTPVAEALLNPFILHKF